MLAVEVVVGMPVQVFLIAAADQMTARHDTLLYVTFAATFNAIIQHFAVLVISSIFYLVRDQRAICQFAVCNIMISPFDLATPII